MPLSRRSFISVLGAAPFIVTRPRAAASRYPIAFSTLGCPKWPWKTILDTAAREGYVALEMRGLLGEMDLPMHPHFSAANIPTVKADLKALDLRIASLGASAQMHHADAATRASHLDGARRFIDLAGALGVPYIRVFGDRKVAGEAPEVTHARIAAGLDELAAHAKGSGVTVLIETHGDFTSSSEIVSIISKAGPGSAVLWDAHHTVIAGKEAPADTWAQFGTRVRHTHLKDSVADGANRRYVATGTGEARVRDVVRTLASAKYQGLYCFEWEKAWHPTIDEPEVAFPHYATVMRDWLRELGVQPT